MTVAATRDECEAERVECPVFALMRDCGMLDRLGRVEAGSWRWEAQRHHVFGRNSEAADHPANTIRLSVGVHDLLHGSRPRDERLAGSVTVLCLYALMERSLCEGGIDWATLDRIRSPEGHWVEGGTRAHVEVVAVLPEVEIYRTAVLMGLPIAALNPTDHSPLALTPEPFWI